MTGLLAGLWEFPSLLQEEKSSDHKHKKNLSDEINRILGTHCTGSLLQDVGEVGFLCHTDLPHAHTYTFSMAFGSPLLLFFFSFTHRFTGCSHLLPHPPDVCGSQLVFEGCRHTCLQ